MRIIKKFEKTRSLITGVLSGIGCSIAIEMSKLGVILFLTDINSEKLKETSEMIHKHGGLIGKQKFQFLYSTLYENIISS